MTTPTINTNEIMHIHNARAKSISFPNNAISAGISSLNYYEEGTHTTTVTGAALVSVTCKMSRIGKLVTMQIPAVANQTMAAAVSFTTAIPSRWRPADTVQFPVNVIDNSTSEPGTIKITSAGVVTIGLVLTGTANTDPSVFTAATGNPFGSNGLVLQWIAA